MDIDKPGLLSRIWKAMLEAASARFWVMAGAAIAMTMVALFVISILTWHWAPLIETARRIDILGKALWFILLGIILIVIALTGQKVDIKSALGSLSAGGGSDDAPAAKVTTTTTTNVETPPKG